MQELKYRILSDVSERRIAINCLNKMRNKLISEGKYTDAVDNIFLKIANSPIKKFKIKYKEV